MQVQCLQGPEGGDGSPGALAKAIVRHLACVLGMELRASARAKCTPNH